MSLTSLWKSQECELGAKHIQAMVGLAGDGRLPSEMLARYANECLGAENLLRQALRSKA